MISGVGGPYSPPFSRRGGCASIRISLADRVVSNFKENKDRYASIYKERKSAHNSTYSSVKCRMPSQRRTEQENRNVTEDHWSRTRTHRNTVAETRTGAAWFRALLSHGRGNAASRGDSLLDRCSGWESGLGSDLQRIRCNSGLSRLRVLEAACRFLS